MLKKCFCRSFYSVSKTCNVQFLMTLMFIMLPQVHLFNIAPKATYEASLPVGASNVKSSYFGYSVGILRTERDTWLLVGAPRANSTSSPSVVEPGALYKCPVNNPSESCKEVILDVSQRNFRLSGINPVIPFRDNSWTGASLDIDEEGNVIVCAPRWKNRPQTYNEYRISGVCYNVGKDLSDLSAYILSPLTDPSNQVFNYYGKYVHFYSNGQCGMSVHLTEDKELLIGAPGVLNWQGSIVRYKHQKQVPSGGVSKRSPSVTYHHYTVPNPIMTAILQDSGFFGYSVTSGFLGGDGVVYHVAGAPRGASFQGLVMIFKIRPHLDQPFFMKEAKEGTQMGEYFGASVAVVDFNNDGYSDLVVGAPMHSFDDLYDVGCAYVFINDIEANELSAEGIKLYGDIEKRARFGTALGTPGDLDMDGYDDLLVGAPYENNEAGAVYVFMGSRNGIRNAYSQKLLPEKASRSLSLKGFGVSFSRPLDIDQNLYPDFAVGSFLSDSAVIMSTRPVVEVLGQLSAEPSKLTLTQESFNIRPCVYYRGTGVPEKIDINARIELSQESAAGEVLVAFSDTGSIKKETVFRASRNSQKCQTFRVNVELARSNAQNPVIIRMNYWLKKDVENGPDNPIMAPYKSSAPNLILSFITGCRDEICKSDLVTFAQFKGFDSKSTLLIGELSKLTLEITVVNKEDPAFLPNLTMIIPDQIKVLPTISECNIREEMNYTSMTCQIKNPLKRFERAALNFDLDISNLHDMSPEIKMPIIADSASDTEINPEDNLYTAKLKTKKEAFLQVTGWSQPEQFTYERKSIDQLKSNETISIKHIFSIEKSGATPLREVYVDVRVPVMIEDEEGKETSLLQLMENEVNFNSKTKSCQVTEEQKTNPHIFSSQKSVFNCSTPGIKCSRIKCAIGPWKKTSVASLTLEFKINIADLVEFIKVSEGFTISSQVKVGVSSHKYIDEIEGQREDSATVDTLFHPGSLPLKQLMWWGYVLAALGGILVLFVISLILHKVGFFRRKKKEELKAEQATIISQEQKF